MVRVALTGGIATGKSTVLRVLQAREVPTIDADVLAREVVAPGTPGLGAIVERFGRAVLDADGALDRRALAALVFCDPRARHDLERDRASGRLRRHPDWLHGSQLRRRWPLPTSRCCSRLVMRLTSIGSSSRPARRTSSCAA